MASKRLRTKRIDIHVEWEPDNTGTENGIVMADVEFHTWDPKVVFISFPYGIHSYRFKLEPDKAREMATRCLLGYYPILTVKLEFAIDWRQWDQQHA